MHGAVVVAVDGQVADRARDDRAVTAEQPPDEPADTKVVPVGRVTRSTDVVAVNGPAFCTQTS